MLKKAVYKQLLDIFGHENIIQEDLMRYRKSTLGHDAKVAAALVVKNEQQIIDCLTVARANNMSLYPISTGNNWGYGGATPIKNGSMILDLSQLNKIMHFDKNLGVVTVQPGVTQQQLRDFLDQNSSKFMVPTTGAGPNCSLLANALERGFGASQYNDHFSAITHFKVILGNGSIYQSSFTDLNAPLSDKAFRWGVGPYLDGIFTQSNFGIVTEATIALSRQHESFSVIHCGFDDIDALTLFTSKIREVLFEYGQNIGLINLMNDRRILSMLTEFPYDLNPESGYLDQEYINEQAKTYKVHRWNIMAVIQGSPGIVKACKKGIKRILNGNVDTLRFISRRQLKLMGALSAFFPQKHKYVRMVESLKQATQLVNGSPNELALPLAYWLNRNSRPVDNNLNPDRDDCGLIWYAPVIPMLGSVVNDFVEMIYRLCGLHDFEPLLTLTATSPRFFESTFPILYDKSKPLSAEKARKFFEVLVGEGKKIGVFPYRLPCTHMDLLTKANTSHMELVKKIKKIMDPDDIIAPGRYCEKIKNDDE